MIPSLTSGSVGLRHVVLDAAAFLTGAKLDNFGAELKYYMIPDVAAEIKDAKSKQLLQTFPYKIHERQISDDALKAVVDFARKTGDIASLSKTDLRVLALVYMLEKENHGISHLRTQPRIARDLAAAAPKTAAAAKSNAPSTTAAAAPSFASERKVAPFSVDDLLFLTPQQFTDKYGAVSVGPVDTARKATIPNSNTAAQSQSTSAAAASSSSAKPASSTTAATAAAAVTGASSAKTATTAANSSNVTSSGSSSSAATAAKSTGATKAWSSFAAGSSAGSSQPASASTAPKSWSSLAGNKSGLQAASTSLTSASASSSSSSVGQSLSLTGDSDATSGFPPLSALKPPRRAKGLTAQSGLSAAASTTASSSGQKGAAKGGAASKTAAADDDDEGDDAAEADEGDEADAEDAANEKADDGANETEGDGDGDAEGDAAVEGDEGEGEGDVEQDEDEIDRLAEAFANTTVAKPPRSSTAASASSTAAATATATAPTSSSVSDSTSQSARSQQQSEQQQQAKRTSKTPSVAGSTAAVSVAGWDDPAEGEWITPDNLRQHELRDAKAASLRPIEAPPPTSSVACVTSDFAMQNVLLQMGLRLLSVNGLAITSLRQFVLRCHACSHVVRQMDRQFCPSCGNNTLVKASLFIDAQGVAHVRHNTRRKFNLRGLKYSIPLPKGGRNQTDLKLREDVVKVPGKGRFADKLNRSGGDMFGDAVEFGLRKTGPASREFTIGYGRTNPNAVKNRTNNKRKKRRN